MADGRKITQLKTHGQQVIGLWTQTTGSCILDSIINYFRFTASKQDLELRNAEQAV